MAGKRLDIEQENNAFILAISCHQKSFKLAWEINRAIKCELQGMDAYDQNIPFINSIEGHAYYQWNGPTERFTLHLISNQGENGILIPHMKQIDYFFIATGMYEELDFKGGVQKIKKIESVLTAFTVSLSDLKK